MNLFLRKASIPFAAMLALTGCTDDKYDLDDLDTTSQIPINDVVLPVNLEAIRLDDVIELSDNDNIVEATEAGGKKIYAFDKRGKITTDDVVIDAIEVTAEEVESTSAMLTRNDAETATLSDAVAYDMAHMTSQFSYSAANVDEAVETIDFIETVEPMLFNVTLGVPANVAADGVRMKDMKLHFPPGLYMTDGTPAHSTAGTYDPATGIVTVADHASAGGHSVTIEVEAYRCDMNANGVTIGSDRRLTFTGDLEVLDEGWLIVTPSAGASLPAAVGCTGDYSLSHFFVRNFDGRINYTVDGIDIEPITFDDLPDFLKSDQTQIFLANPQIYITARNNTADYQTSAGAAISLTSYFSNNSERNELSDAFVMGYDLGPDKIYNIVLSPDGQQTVPQPEFADNIHKYTYAGLSDVLAAEGTPAGLPDRIEVELEDPRFFGDAKRFPVEVPGLDPSEYTIEGLNGEYTMFAPLAFDPETRIIYSKIDDGWESEDLDGLSITRMKLRAHATTTIDMNVVLTVYALDANGNKMGRSLPVTLPPMADTDIEMIVEATAESPIKALDGVEYHAVVSNEKDGHTTPLGPDETIDLTGIKVNIDGSYTKDF